MNLSSTAFLPTIKGQFRIQAVRDNENKEHLIIYTGELTGKENIPVRVHSECLTGEVLGSLRCDCKDQLGAALAYIQEKGVGLVIYLRQEGRGIGLFNKVEAYNLQDNGFDTIAANLELGFPADMRTYEIAAQILHAKGINSIELLTNNPEKVDGLEKNGIRITRRIPMIMKTNEFNEDYLHIKKTKMNHSLHEE
jgi:GTP cyclohydrolase II